jgi:hypothetical protein
MVKNSTGGNRMKSFARKSFQTGKQNNIKLPSDPLEHFAIVSKILGNGMCYVIISTLKDPIICHIRKKFSGRYKKDNLIQAGTFLMVGLREWESTPQNCDVIEVYGHSDLALLQTLPNFTFTAETISSFTRNGNKPKEEEYISFDENAEEKEEYTDGVIMVSNTSEEINIEDI